MSTVVVTGAGGQLGTELTRFMWPSDVRVVALTEGALDLTDAGLVRKTLEELRPDVVVNAAAYTAVDRAESEPERANAVNHLAPGTLAEACAALDARLIHVSTDYVFDGSKLGAYVPGDPVAPLGVYGATKLAGEVAVRAALPQHLIVRTSWVVAGHGQNFIRTMLRLARERDELRVVNDQHGCLTHAADFAAALARVATTWLDSSASPTYGTFHYAGADAATWFDVATEVVALQASHTGRSPRVLPIPTSAYPTPARRPVNSVLDSSALVARYGVVQQPWRHAASRAVASLLESGT